MIPWDYCSALHSLWFLPPPTPLSSFNKLVRSFRVPSKQKDSLVAQTIKNPPAMHETWVGSLGWEDPLEESMATHSSILAWKIPMDRSAWWATVHRSQRVRHNWATKHTVQVLKYIVACRTVVMYLEILVLLHSSFHIFLCLWISSS